MWLCLELGADLHMAQLMPLSLTVSCFSKIQIGFTFLVPAHPGSPGQRAGACACMYWQKTHRDKCLFEQDRLQGRVQRFADIFQQDWVSNADRVFERAHKAGVGHFDDPESVQTFAVAHPAICLSHNSKATNSQFPKLVCVQPPPSVVNMTLPASAAGRPPLSNDISCAHGYQFRRPSVWPHHTSVTAAALAASPSARCVQDRGARTSVACWTGSRVPRRRLTPSVGHWSSPIAVQFQWHSEAACSTNT